MSGKVKKAAADKPEEEVVDKAPRSAALKKELEAERDKLQKELQPHREYHDAHVNDKKFIEARKKIKEISAKLGPIQNELAALARAGGSKGIQAEGGTFTKKSEE